MVCPYKSSIDRGSESESKLVKLSFNQRRKKLKNALKTKIIDLKNNNLDLLLDLLNKRAEELSVEKFITLANLIYPNES